MRVHFSRVGWDLSCLIKKKIDNTQTLNYIKPCKLENMFLIKNISVYLSQLLKIIKKRVVVINYTNNIVYC